MCQSVWPFSKMRVGDVAIIAAERYKKAQKMYRLYGKITAVKLPDGSGAFWKYPEHLDSNLARAILIVRCLRPKVFSGSVFSGDVAVRGPGISMVTRSPDFIRIDDGFATLTDRGESLFVAQPRMVNMKVPEDMVDDLARYIQQHRLGSG